MNARKTLLGLVAAALLAIPAGAADAFRVIAHESVNATTMSTNDLALVFLKKMTFYPGTAQRAIPFDLAEDSSAREAFSRAIYRKPLTAVRAYWRQQIFSGRGAPPPELRNDEAVMARVAATRGGIGYVSADATLPRGVKHIQLKD